MLGRALFVATGLAMVMSSSCTDQPPSFNLECNDVRRLTQLRSDEFSGIEQCGDDFYHRYEAVACPLTLEDDCATDEDCAPGGRCVDDGEQGLRCGYGCQTDADCGAGQACICASTLVSDRPTCVSASCATDADCGGGLCGVESIYLDVCSGGAEQRQVTLACLNEQSECRRSVHCAEVRCERGEFRTPGCGIDDGQWACQADDVCSEPQFCG